MSDDPVQPGGPPDNPPGAPRDDASPPPRRDPRLRTVAVIVAVGVGLAIVGAVGVGALGGDGRTGAAVLLLVLSLGMASGAVVALGSAVLDEYRDRPVSAPRIVVGIVLFVAAAAFMAMTAGVGG